MALLKPGEVDRLTMQTDGRRIGPAWLVLTLLTILVNPGRAVGDDAETKVKAAYTYNFTKYVEWPAERFSGGGIANTDRSSW